MQMYRLTLRSARVGIRSPLICDESHVAGSSGALKAWTPGFLAYLLVQHGEK